MIWNEKFECMPREELKKWQRQQANGNYIIFKFTEIIQQLFRFFFMISSFSLIEAKN